MEMLCRPSKLRYGATVGVGTFAPERKNMRNWFCDGGLLLVAIGALVMCGCGGDSTGYPVKGTVKFADGSPLTKGVIVFDNGQTSAMGELKPDGTFELTNGAEPGTHTIFFSGEATGGDYGKPLVATKYISPAQSDLRVEVRAEPNVFDEIVVEKAR